MTYKVSNPVGAAIPAIVETTDQENVKQYDLFNIVKPKNILDALSGLFPTINDPFNALPNGYLSRFNQYIGLFGPIDLASLYDSKIVTKVWEVKTKTILQFPYVTNQNGIFTVQKSSWKAPMNFTSTYWTRQLIGADVANSMGFTGQGITTTVIDTGGTQLNKQTPRLKKYTVVDLNYSDTIGHGEWCASCIGGQMAVDDTFSALQGKQVVCQGMAPACNLQEIKALDYVIGTGTDAQLLHALNKAIDIGSDVISCSWGGSETASQPQDDPYYNALQALVNNNVIPVFAAGNSGPNPGTVASPGWLPQALTVGAYNAVDNSQINAFGPAGQVSTFSSRGPTPWGDIKPDTVAPGAVIDSGITGWMMGSYTGIVHPFQAIAGTSMATPHVAGLVTLMRQAHSQLLNKVLTVEEIKSMLAALGVEKTNDYGWGPITWQMYMTWLQTQYGLTFQ